MLTIVVSDMDTAMQCFPPFKKSKIGQCLLYIMYITFKIIISHNKHIKEYRSISNQRGINHWPTWDMNWQHHSKNNTIKSVPVCCLYWCTPYFELMEHSFVSDKQTHCTQCCGFLHRQALPIFTLEKDSIYRLSNLCTHKEGNGHKSRAKNTTRDAEVIAIVILFCRWNMGGRIKFWQGIGFLLGGWRNEIVLQPSNYV